MISRIHGTLLARDGERVEIETGGGVVYEVELPVPVLQRLPSVGGSVELRTVQVVSETSTALYGFIDGNERTLFRRLLGASGVGAKLALAMMSTYSAERLARALQEKDTTALRQVSGIGKKTAEKIALELADKMDDLAIITPSVGRARPGGAQEAVQALVALGYSFADADKAVRAVLAEGDLDDTDELIRRALAE